MAEHVAIQNFYAEDFSWCYGCGHKNAAGHHFKTYWGQDGVHTITEFTPKAEHIAIPGFVYGGLLASLIDCHSTGSAALALYRQEGHEPGDSAPVPRCVTASLKVDYLRPTPLGPMLRAVGEIGQVGTKKVEVFTVIYVGDMKVVTGQAVLVRAPASMTGNS